jgi:hypothetical protein
LGATCFFGWALILTKDGLGHVLGDFFSDSSGHPVDNKVVALKTDIGLSIGFHKTWRHMTSIQGKVLIGQSGGQ